MSDVGEFYAAACASGKVTPVDGMPQVWSLGGTPGEADELLTLVLAGTKTSTAGALWDYEAEQEPLPRVGELSIITDGAGRPRAVIKTTCVAVVPFDEVTAEHAAAEGEGDRSLAYWRRVHQQFFTEFATHTQGFAADMPVVCQSFQLLYPNE